MIRRIAILILLAALLAACGAAPAAPQATTAPTDAPAPTSAPAVISADHPGGTITLEQPATRVVACSEEALDFLVALNVQAVGFCSDRSEGAASGQPYTLPHFFPPERIGTPTFVGTAATPSAELIATLDPDLIISTDYTEGNAQLAQIAPTYVLSVDVPGYWRETLQDIGRLVGRSAEAEAFLAEYDATVARLAAQVAPVAAESPDLLIVYSFGAGDGTMFLGNDWTGSRPFTQLGFTVLEPEGVNFSNGVAPISAETAAQAEADIIFVLRPQLPDGSRPSYPLDDLLASRDDTRVIYQVFPSTRGSTAPYTDRFVLEEVAGLLAAPAAAAGDTRTVTDDLGRTVEVPASPQRIVALQDLQVLRPLLDLGVTPIAATTHPAYDGAFRFVEEYDVSGIAQVGLLGEPNLEQLVLLKPDLIIGTLSASTDAQIETLSAIAPTLVYNAGRPVVEYHRSLAEAAGALEAYNALMADYEARLGELRAGVAPISDELVVSLLAFNPNAGQIEIGEGPYTLIFRGAGISQPAPQMNFESADEGVRRYWISPELLPEHDADLIFLLYSRDPAVNAPITDSPIWATLSAVKAGQVVEIDGSTWYVQSVRSLFNVIDALEQHLVGADIDTGVFE